MKFYIASKLENYEQVKDLSLKLKNAGWVHTYDWTVHGSVKEVSIERLKEVGQLEYNGINEADVVIVLTPQGRGTHTELGIALAMNKQIYLCHADNRYFQCDDNTSAFYWLPQIKQLTGNTDEIAKMLLNSIKIERS